MCVICLLFFFCFFVVSYIRPFFYRVTQFMKPSNLKKNGEGNIREPLLLNRLRFTSLASLSLSVGGAPHFDPTSNHSLVGPFSASFLSSTKLAAAQLELQACETHLAPKNASWRSNGVSLSVIGSEVGKEALRALEEMETEFPGKNFSFICMQTVTYECFTKRTTTFFHHPPVSLDENATPPHVISPLWLLSPPPR